MSPETGIKTEKATDRAMLWVNRPDFLLERAGGLSVLERQLITMELAGIRRVWIGVKSPGEQALAALRLPKTIELHWSSRSMETPAECKTPYLGVSGDHFVRADTLGYIVHAPYKASVSFNDSRGLSVVQFIAERASDSLAYHKQPLPENCSVYLDLPLSQGPAMAWLLSLGPKAQDGFMARHFDRHISLAVSRAVLDTPVTPNMMTALSCLVGLAGAALFTYAHHDFDLAGAVLVWLHSVLDGCDGELARVRLQESRWGGDFDFWADNLVHLALFAAISMGFFRSTGSPLALILGVAAGLGILGSAGLTFSRRLRERAEAAVAASSGKSEISRSAPRRVENILAQRDFIYLLLAMTALHMTYYFLWAGAIGAPLFLILILSNVEKNNEKITRAIA